MSLGRSKQKKKETVQEDIAIKSENTNEKGRGKERSIPWRTQHIFTGKKSAPDQVFVHIFVQMDVEKFYTLSYKQWQQWQA